jgi:hypothetical protein
LLTLLTALSWTAPLAAAEAAAGGNPTSIRAAMIAQMAKAGPARSARFAQTPATTTATVETPRSFFSTGRGKVLLALTAATVGFAIYSTQANDVTRAPQRKQ